MRLSYPRKRHLRLLACLVEGTRDALELPDGVGQQTAMDCLDSAWVVHMQGRLVLTAHGEVDLYRYRTDNTLKGK